MEAIVIKNTKNMPREEWLKERQQGIGGSDAAAIAGINPYRTPLQVYFDKTGTAALEPEQSEAAYWGTVLEDVIAKEFSKRTGFKVQRKNAILKNIRYPFMLANIDREIIDKEQGNGVLECKTASAYLAKKWEDNQLPDEYMLQIQHYLAVTGYQYAYIAVLIGGQRFDYKRVERDDEIIAQLIQIEGDFWERIQNEDPPEWTGQGKEEEILSQMYPPEGLKEEETELPETVEELCREYQNTAQTAAKYDKKKKELSTLIKGYMKNFSTGYGRNYRVSIQKIERTSFDTKAMKLDGVFDKYAQTTSSKRMTIKALKEE